MKIIFNGDSGQIDANTLIAAIGHYQYIMEAANKELGGEKTVELKINAIEKGSFVIDVEVVENFLKSIFSSNAVNYAAGLVTIIGGVYGAYHKLKGKSAKTIEQKESIYIKGDNNVAINKAIVNIYNQIPVREAISKTIEAAQKDDSVDGLTIESKLNKVRFDKEDFAEYIHKSFDSDDMLPPDKVTTEEARLTIISMSFESGYQWQFMYRGFKIPIRIKEGALMKIIDNGERFGKGDVLEVTLEITSKYNPSYRAYENVKYKIEKFHKHIPAPIDATLFEGD
ncbi:MAG: hypothetical protein NC102_09425 [Clostridium sp.]|nr:hypothetical protein [Clostridium sp.]